MAVLLDALGKRVQTVPADKQAFKVEANREEDDYTVNLTFNDGGNKVAATVWEGQSVLLALHNEGNPDGVGFYLLTVD